jgi:hypothetical protein
MESKLIQLTEELWDAIDEARGESKRGPWIEKQLRRLSSIRQAAEMLGLEFKERPKPGVYDRSSIIGAPRGTKVRKR